MYKFVKGRANRAESKWEAGQLQERSIIDRLTPVSNDGCRVDSTLAPPPDIIGL